MSSYRRSRGSGSERGTLEDQDRRAANIVIPVDEEPDAATRRAKRRVRESVGAIIDALQRQAEKGSCAHAKLLFEFAGIEFGAEENGQKDSLAAILLQRLEEMQRRWREQHSGDFPPFGEATSPKVE